MTACEVPMPSRRDSTSKLLRQLFDEARTIRQHTKQLFDSEVALRAGTSFDQLFNFDNDVMHAAASRCSLRLDKADENDAAMLSAFETAGLDHRNPLDWRTLLSLFAEAHFGKIRTKPQKWDVAALLDVLTDYREVQRSDPGLSDVKICTLLQTKSKYSNYTLDALRKLVRHARSPKYNVLLRHPEMRDPLLQIFREKYESRGVVWDPQREANLKRLIDKCVDIIDKTNQGNS
jgi:hypothetical protein